MIDALKSLFRPRPSASGRDIAPELAVAVLLVEAAKADGSYSADEREAVTALLSEMFDFSPPDSPDALRARAEEAQAVAPDLVRFTRVIKFGIDHSERLSLIEALWKVVLIDHHRDPHEDALLRHLAPLLGVDDRESVHARQRVLARAGH